MPWGKTNGRLEWGDPVWDEAGQSYYRPIVPAGGPVVLLSYGYLRDAGYGRLRAGRAIPVGSQMFYLIESVFEASGFVGVRIDGPLWWLWVFWYLCTTLERRITLTCTVWGLARHDLMTKPTWDDIHLVRWVKQRRAKISQTACGRRARRRMVA